MSLKDSLVSDMTGVFLNTDDFAEEVIYTNVDGEQRTIKAMVFRDPVQNDLNVPQPKLRIIVANDSTSGISSDELDTGGDTITVAYRKGEDAQEFGISRSPTGGEDEGGLKLELN